MTSNQVEIKYMIAKLNEWNELLGGSQAKKSLAASEFDYLQQEFLTKRYQVDRFQDQKQKQGITIKNANISYQIREGIQSLKGILAKLIDQLQRLTKKKQMNFYYKKESNQILERKQKIVKNCELLLQDIQQREQTNGPQYKNKVNTLTDLKAKLLNEIDENNDKIHATSSRDRLQENNSQEDEAIRQYRKKDQQMDDVLVEIIDGVKVLKGKVKNINQQQDQINQKTKQGNKKAQKLEKRIQKDNDQLKVIIEKFKPSRCCLGIALFLLFVGLIVCVIKLVI